MDSLDEAEFSGQVDLQFCAVVPVHELSPTTLMIVDSTTLIHTAKSTCPSKSQEPDLILN